MDYILEIDNLSKSFSGVKALSDVSLHVRKGTVHALMGENGAGKSTIMKCLLGIYTPDGGTIKFKGKPVVATSITHALKLGISMIHQELSTIQHLTVLENMYLGREITHGKSWFNDEKKMRIATLEIFKTLGLDINPNKKMHELSIAQQQMCEIAKAISYNADLIIMDEPTSAITEKEVEHLFTIMRKLIEKGITIIYISHKMDEIFKISNDITIFRDGKYILTSTTENITREELINKMVGRSLSEIFETKDYKPGEKLLEVKNLTRTGEFENVSFHVKRGEVLGFAGLMGAGRSEVMETLFGARKKTSGEVFINGEKVTIDNPGDAITNKMALLTEDRKKNGCFLILPVGQNIIMSSIKKHTVGKFFLKDGEIKNVCLKAKEDLRVKTPSLTQPIKFLSGGNQQKVLIARWLETEPDILIVDEPTRGIDIGAKSEIYKIINTLASQNKAIIVVSSELPEILGICDRIMVMCEGKITGELSRAEATQQQILYHATETM